MADDARQAGGAHPVSIEQLIALNDEIIALTRAGVPLERGLMAAGADLPGRLGGVARALGERMSRGETLAEALESSGAAVPPVYRAVVEAGVRSGRLSTALEGLAAYARGYAEARGSVVLALWYPMLVLALAYGLFLMVSTRVIPRFIQTFETMGLTIQWPMRLLAWLGATAWTWGPVVPALLAAVVLAGAFSGRASALGGRGAFGVLRWFPWTGSMLRGFEAASFAEMLALLVEQKVAYPKALVLAGEASGDPALAASSREIAAVVERGLPPGDALRGRSPFPPLLRCLLAGGPREADLIGSLRQMAERYRCKARDQAEALRVLLPTVLLFGIGATATLLYALALFVPMTSLWWSLSNATS